VLLGSAVVLVTELNSLEFGQNNNSVGSYKKHASYINVIIYPSRGYSRQQTPPHHILLLTLEFFPLFTLAFRADQRNEKSRVVERRIAY